MDGLAMHEIGSHETREGKWAFDRFLGGVRHRQQQIRDRCDGQLDADGVRAGADELRDPERLLDPAEEQLDLPSCRRRASPRRVL